DCSSVDACDEGLDCISSAFGTMRGKCAPFLDVNQMCADANVLETGCPRDTRCDLRTRLCLRIGLKGADCSNMGCDDYLYCDGNTMQCTPQVALGATCTPPPSKADADPCSDGTCDPMTKKCTVVCM